jgi:glycosyltransferase involved in cell wall biosynthesis
MSDAEYPANSVGSDFLGLEGRYLRTFHKIWRVASRRTTDTIVATDLRLFVLSVIACGLRLRDPRNVAFWINSVPLVIEGQGKRILFRLLSVRSPLLFASEAIRREHDYSWHRGKTGVVYYGVADHGFRQYRGQSTSNAPLMLQYTAEFVAWKNHRTLIEALPEVVARGHDLELRLVGTGSLLDECQALSRVLGLADRIEFTGPRHDAKELLVSCDLYIQPSLGEGLGIAVVEAMLAGVPVLAANSGAFPEYIEDGVTGLLTGCDSPRQLVDGLSRALHMLETGDLKEIAAQGQRAARSRFAMDRFASDVAAFLSQ